MGLAFLISGGKSKLTLSDLGNKPSPGDLKLQGFLFGKIFIEEEKK
jgi:hypothetical protein